MFKQTPLMEKIQKMDPALDARAYGTELTHIGARASSVEISPS
jgi:hypothetical protein